MPCFATRMHCINVINIGSQFLATALSKSAAFPVKTGSFRGFHEIPISLVPDRSCSRPC